ncbi:major sperm protein domain-containing protein [Hamiltosporidium tvaerminnensis]|uniref:Major sperm protein domain-containing protein n=2 Tax=Hamiltosporidium TaxID=1176354 RepID=A0A4V2JVF3_9MICR|nr:hypothetical protein LUQ84_003056 [Hamiltosporidium tvaerminnensis]TBT97629.1 major sperm protein domain-containing protein [Hamiltosporidium magnivora]TBT99887.1 major sperm protein domain-containing protein [Hamiltosporidium tvaerminnensis]TBU03832.1 major sperm protein domain-containing protein [Hamiltosporidium magnivora]TBU11969.1 major sperm protein domain-containing protein [Hamiltosporidium tvaerminnensis]
MSEVIIRPQDKITIKEGERVSILTIYNSSVEGKGFRIRTTRPKEYLVKPTSGIIIPLQTVEIQLFINETAVPASDHKFMVEIYDFDWRKTQDDFKEFLKDQSVKPLMSHKLSIEIGDEIKENGKQFEIVDAMSWCVIGYAFMFLIWKIISFK